MPLPARPEPIAAPAALPAPATASERLPLPSFDVAAPAPRATAPSPAAAPAPTAQTLAAPATAPAQAIQTVPGTAGAAPSRPVTPGPEAAAAARSVAGGGSPDAGARVGHDVATAPSLPASAPRLNLELVRPRGGVISSQGSRGLLPMVPHPPEAKDKLAEDIAKAAKADCRKAYGQLGLAAVVPLAADALRDRGCRW